MALIREYFDLTEKYKKEYGEDSTVLLMQVGSFFECYGMKDPATNTISNKVSNLKKFTQICDLAVANKNICIGKNNVVMAGFQLSQLERYLKKMEEEGMTIVVHAQDEKDSTKRELAGIFSPGTMFLQEFEEQQKITNNICCIWVSLVAMNKSIYKKILPREYAATNVSGKTIYIGISNIDIYTGKSIMFEYNEPYHSMEPNIFDKLDNFICSNLPSECIIIGNLSIQDLQMVAQYSNITSKMVHYVSLTEDAKNKMTENAFRSERQTYQVGVLKQFYGEEKELLSRLDFQQNTIAVQSFCFLLDFVYQHSPHLVSRISEPLFQSNSDRLLLANHSLKQLNIVDDGNHTGSCSSVLRLLNRCITTMGKRAFSYQLLNPTATDIAYLQKEYEMTDYILSNYDSFHYLNESLSEIKDVSKMNRKIIMLSITPNQLYYLYSNLDTLCKMYDRMSVEFQTYLSISDIKEECLSLVGTFDRYLVMKECIGYNETAIEKNIFKRGIERELDEKLESYYEITDKLEAIRVTLNTNMSVIEKKKGANTTEYIKIYETEKGNMSFIATKKRCSALLNAIQPTAQQCVQIGYVSTYNGAEKTFEFDIFKLETGVQSSTNNYLKTPMIDRLIKTLSQVNSELRDIYKRVYNRLLTELTTTENQRRIHKVVEFVTKTDVIYTKAKVAKMYNYCRPEIIENAEKSCVNAVGLRHPLIEQINMKEIYTANDCSLGMGQTDGMVIYGVNSSGKTSYVRSLLSIIMAQSGLFVPAKSFQYYPYRKLFTRIIGNDNLFKNLSTFATEMLELKQIIMNADKYTLVLGDELAVGTETISAISIFTSTLLKLHEIGCSYIFTSHYHEIVNLTEIKALTTLRICHMSVVYDKERDKLVYNRKLQEGVGSCSYGIEFCSSLNFPPEFLQMAHSIRQKYEKDIGVGYISVLSQQPTRYNAKKIGGGLCEICKKAIAVEVHHIAHQQDADADGYIRLEDGTIFHKNHPANLSNICRACHLNIHDD